MCFNFCINHQLGLPAGGRYHLVVSGNPFIDSARLLNCSILTVIVVSYTLKNNEFLGIISMDFRDSGVSLYFGVPFLADVKNALIHGKPG